MSILTSADRRSEDIRILPIIIAELKFRDIVRRLADKNQRVRVYGGPCSAAREYILVDERKGIVLERWKEFPVALARKLGALSDWEEVQ